MTVREKYDIVAGPSREELFDALRLVHEGRTVEMTVLRNDETSNDLSKALRIRIPVKSTFAVLSILAAVKPDPGSSNEGDRWVLHLLDLNSSGMKKPCYFNTTTGKGYMLDR
jgi:hypothetical protein